MNEWVSKILSVSGILRVHPYNNATVGLASECSQNFLTQTSWVITGTRASSSDWSILGPMSHSNQPDLRQIFVFQQTHPPVIRQTENPKFVLYQLSVLIRNNTACSSCSHVSEENESYTCVRCRTTFDKHCHRWWVNDPFISE